MKDRNFEMLRYIHQSVNKHPGFYNLLPQITEEDVFETYNYLLAAKEQKTKRRNVSC